MPGSLHPYTHADSFVLQLPIESLGVTIFMVQSPFSALTGFFRKKSNLLKTRVVIHAYNHHVRLLSPESLVVRQPSLLGPRSRHCYAIKWFSDHFYLIVRSARRAHRWLAAASEAESCFIEAWRLGH